MPEIIKLLLFPISHHFPCFPDQLIKRFQSSQKQFVPGTLLYPYLVQKNISCLFSFIYAPFSYLRALSKDVGNTCSETWVTHVFVPGTEEESGYWRGGLFFVLDFTFTAINIRFISWTFQSWFNGHPYYQIGKSWSVFMPTYRCLYQVQLVVIFHIFRLLCEYLFLCVPGTNVNVYQVPGSSLKLPDREQLAGSLSSGFLSYNGKFRYIRA
jgi:hypothetical protein